jgi:hypothetical protein
MATIQEISEDTKPGPLSNVKCKATQIVIANVNCLTEVPVRQCTRRKSKTSSQKRNSSRNIGDMEPKLSNASFVFVVGAKHVEMLGTGVLAGAASMFAVVLQCHICPMCCWLGIQRV